MRSELVALLLFAMCAKPAPPPPPVAATTTTSTTTTSSEASAGPRVIFPDGYSVHVELATTDETRAQGLMFRDRLRPASGMLFLFTANGNYPFWMKNTLIPLDMIWIDQQKRVAHVKQNVPPCQADPCPSYDPKAEARYVLEVAGGVTKEHPLKPGDQLRFEEVDNVVVR